MKKTKAKRKPAEFIKIASQQRNDLIGKPLEVTVSTIRFGTKMFLIERSPKLADRLVDAIASVCRPD